MSKSFFVAGTDTEVGKTHVSELMLRRAAGLGQKSLGLKPVAAGACRNEGGELENEDALRLMSASSVMAPYRVVNPLCVPEPLSPHIAIKRAGGSVDVSALLDSLKQGFEARADFTLVEGAGGWRVPINDEETMADLAKALKLPVILVVGMRLGCLNHALLTVDAIRADGLELFGWVANRVDPEMSAFDENLDTLRRKISAPLLACIPHATDVANTDVQSQFDMCF